MPKTLRVQSVAGERASRAALGSVERLHVITVRSAAGCAPRMTL